MKKDMFEFSYPNTITYSVVGEVKVSSALRQGAGLTETKNGRFQRSVRGAVSNFCTVTMSL